MTVLNINYLLKNKLKKYQSKINIEFLQIEVLILSLKVISGIYFIYISKFHYKFHT